MSGATPATRAAAAAGIAFTLREYVYDPHAPSIGLAAAEALGEPPARVLKSLMALVDGRPVCAVLASDRTIAMKRLAAAAGARAAAMMPPPDAERITGYVTGGISPFGQKRRVPVLLDAAALDQPYVHVNGGRRGLQMRLDPAALAAALGAIVAPLAAY